MRAVEPKPEPMTRDTIFDMASLTKPIATATSIMILIEEGKLRLADRLVGVLPEFDNHGKSEITIEQLLRHRAGFIPDNPLADYEQGPDAAWKRIAELELVSRPGERFRYSDVGFLVLGKLVERTSGRGLDAFAREQIFEVLGMKDTHFRPLESSRRHRRRSNASLRPSGRRLEAGCSAGSFTILVLGRWEASPATLVCSRPPTIWRSLPRRS